jgi:hypothetical protein
MPGDYDCYDTYCMDHNLRNSHKKWDDERLCVPMVDLCKPFEASGANRQLFSGIVYLT